MVGHWRRGFAICIPAGLLAGVFLLAAWAGAAASVRSYDPLAYARRVGNHQDNLEPYVPPQCYTRTGAESNPCWVCHTSDHGRNHVDDWELQKKYDFTDYDKTNHWTNLFVDRRPLIAHIDDRQVLTYIRQDNYGTLRAAMRGQQFLGWKPDLDLGKGFDAEGFARDGSGWRAFRYKPFLGTFWPTNGSTDDVMLRLPKRFREDTAGHPSREIYKTNLAIVAAAVGVPDSVPTEQLVRPIEPLAEAAAGIDLDGDGRINGTATVLHGLPPHYVGAAREVPVIRYDYPAGTEFLHTVRYIDPEAPDWMSVRLKELRYAVKLYRQSDHILDATYREVAAEQKSGAPDRFGGNAETGLTNDFGWKLQGWIEDRRGRLRLQTREEQMFCMGCHGGIGVTVDSTFALPRKLPGAAGWGHENLAEIPDVPQAGHNAPEILSYFRRVGGGDEFRANDEILRRFFPRGTFDAPAVRRDGRDIRKLVLPSRQRALALDKAYLSIVRAQGYIKGRDANLAPTLNVYQHLDNTDTALKASDHVYRDGRLWLDWERYP